MISIDGGVHCSNMAVAQLKTPSKCDASEALARVPGARVPGRALAQLATFGCYAILGAPRTQRPCYALFLWSARSAGGEGAWRVVRCGVDGVWVEAGAAARSRARLSSRAASFAMSLAPCLALSRLEASQTPKKRDEEALFRCAL